MRSARLIDAIRTTADAAALPSYGPGVIDCHPLKRALFVHGPAGVALFASVFTLPPAFSIAATALFDAP